jgi:predicted PurR-regulated permease PerM
VHDIRNAGLFIFGAAILAYAIYSLYSALRRSDMKSRVRGLMGFLCLGFVGIVVIGLAMQLWGRKC